MLYIYNFKEVSGMPNKFPPPIEEGDKLQRRAWEQPGPANISPLEQAITADPSLRPGKLMEVLLLGTESQTPDSQ